MERWKGKIQVDNQTIIKVGGRNAQEIRDRITKQLNDLNGRRKK